MKLAWSRRLLLGLVLLAWVVSTPSLAKSRIMMPQQAMQQGSAAEMLRKLEPRLALEPENAKLHFQIGLIHALAMRQGDAISFTGDANGPNAESNRSMAFLQMPMMNAPTNQPSTLKELGAALSELRQAVALDPTLAEAAVTLGMVLEAAGQMDNVDVKLDPDTHVELDESERELFTNLVESLGHPDYARRLWAQNLLTSQISRAIPFLAALPPTPNPEVAYRLRQIKATYWQQQSMLAYQSGLSQAMQAVIGQPPSDCRLDLTGQLALQGLMRIVGSQWGAGPSLMGMQDQLDQIAQVYAPTPQMIQQQVYKMQQEMNQASGRGDTRTVQTLKQDIDALNKQMQKAQQDMQATNMMNGGYYGNLMLE